MNKLSLFGSGTYFSIEPSVSLHYSPFATVWPNSLLGKRLSCLLLCEIIDQPNHVKCAIESMNLIDFQLFLMKKKKIFFSFR